MSIRSIVSARCEKDPISVYVVSSSIDIIEVFDLCHFCHYLWILTAGSQGVRWE